MQLLGQYSPVCQNQQTGLPCCLLEWENKLHLFTQHSDRLEIVHPNGSETRCLNRPYKKVTYDSQHGCFYATSSLYVNTLYLLDTSFCETDAIQVSHPFSCTAAEDIVFDVESNILLLLTGQNICRFNTNGDYLGIWMSAPPGIDYKAAATYRKYVFLAYVRSGCAYLASYTNQGAFLERFCLGGEYQPLNLQVIRNKKGLILRVYALKDYHYLFALDVQLQEMADKACSIINSPAALEVECVSEESGLQSTCFVEEH